MALNGSCLCGGITFTLPLERADVGVCHCSMCRRWAGGPSMIVEYEGAVAFDGSELIGSYLSSEFVERLNCKRCGSLIGTKLAGRDHYWMCAGLIGENDRLTFKDEIFIEDKPVYYAFANDTQKITGAEYLAMWDHILSKS